MSGEGKTFPNGWQQPSLRELIQRLQESANHKVGLGRVRQVDCDDLLEAITQLKAYRDLKDVFGGEG